MALSVEGRVENTNPDVENNPRANRWVVTLLGQM
jgi:hypothetical protein